MALLGDPSSYHYGVTLKQTATHAPDGGAIVDYPKGWRFLPVPHNSEVGEILKKNPAVVYAMDRLHNLSFVPSTKQYARDPNAPRVHQQKTQKYEKVIADAHYNLVIAPQIKAQEEAIARKEEEERLAIATLKMRVVELEKKPTPTPTAPAITTSPTSYLPLAVVGIVIVVILLFLRRRA